MLSRLALEIQICLRRGPESLIHPGCQHKVVNGQRAGEETCIGTTPLQHVGCYAASLREPHALWMRLEFFKGMQLGISGRSSA